MTTVGIRELKGRLSSYIQRAKNGEALIVTDRGKPVVKIAPYEESANDRLGWRLVEAGMATWSGGKPTGAGRRPNPRSGSVADAVVEDRR